jgi:hypothetical protein
VSIQEQLLIKKEFSTLRQKKSTKKNERNHLYFTKEKAMNELSDLNCATSYLDDEYPILLKESVKIKSIFEKKQITR